MEQKIKIIAIVGSLRKESYNLKLAKHVQEYLKDKADVEILNYQEVPFFNEDIEKPAPDNVLKIRGKVDASDALWFFSPEYNHSFSGVLKNLMDWLSRPTSGSKKFILGGKPAAVSGSSPSMAGAVCSQDALVSLLNLLNMRVMNSPRLTVPTAHNQWEEDTWNESVQKKIKKQADAFLDFIEKEKAQIVSNMGTEK